MRTIRSEALSISYDEHEWLLACALMSYYKCTIQREINTFERNKNVNINFVKYPQFRSLFGLY